MVWGGFCLWVCVVSSVVGCWRFCDIWGVVVPFVWGLTDWLWVCLLWVLYLLTGGFLWIWEVMVLVLLVGII